MLRLTERQIARSYDPETIAVISAALKAACSQTDCDETKRRTLAQIILRQIDQGEHDTARLARIATAELARAGP